MCMHVSSLIQLYTLVSFITSCLSSICFLILNPSKLAIVAAQSFLHWHFPFLSFSLTCSMASKPQGSCYTQPWLLQPFHQAERIFKCLVWFILMSLLVVLCDFSSPPGAAALFSQSSHRPAPELGTFHAQGGFRGYCCLLWSRKQRIGRHSPKERQVVMCGERFIK